MSGWSACFGYLLLAGASAALADEPTLRIGIPSEPETLDPSLTTGTYDFSVEADLWEGLTGRDGTNRLIPGAADHWDVSADGLTYVFHLRPELRYSNGEPVHAADFVYMARRAADPATGSENAQWLAPVLNANDILAGKIKDLTELGVAAPDDRTVEVHLKQPSYAFLGFAQQIMPMRQADIEKYGAAWIRPGRMVTDGAFSLDDWVPQSHITLKRNAAYWGAASVKLPAVSYQFVEDPETRLKMFREGELDIAENPPLRDYAIIQAELPNNLRAEPMVGTYYIGLNLSAPPFQGNLKLRQALALVTDPETITNKVIRAGQVPAYSYIPPGLPEGYAAETEFFEKWPSAERLAKAKALYAEAGYGPSNPLKIQIMYMKANDQDHWAAAIAGMWRSALGVDATVDGVEYRIWLGLLNHHQFTAAVDDWESVVRGDADILDEYRSTANNNDVQFLDPAFDRMLGRADAATTLADHLKGYEAAERIFIDAQPIIPIYHVVKLHLVADRVSGWSVNTADTHRTQFISLAGK